MLLLPVAFADEGDPAAVPLDEETTAPLEGAVTTSVEHAVTRLADLGALRQRTSERPTWSDIESALDDLVVAIGVARAMGDGSTGADDDSGSSNTGSSNTVDASAVAGALLDVAIGTEPREREQLTLRVAEVAAALEEGADRRLAQRALVRVLEPLVPAGREASEIGARARTQFERALGVLAEQTAGTHDGGDPPFVRSARHRVERLGVGAPKPPFFARDEAGNELRSDELTGTVTVLRFWSATSAASVAAHERDAELVRAFWDTPFELVGVTSGDDRRGYLEFLDEHGFAGTQLFDGPISVELADALAKASGRLVSPSVRDEPATAPVAWGRPPAGTVFVIDASGTIRGRDLPHAAIRALVEDLVAEENSRRREERLTASRSR
ncbi:MAG: hypothetical protein AAGI22_17155 [Planctomycetota bacterium]